MLFAQYNARQQEEHAQRLGQNVGVQEQADIGASDILLVKVPASEHVDSPGDTGQDGHATHPPAAR
ncbi:MAG: hypothetical protein GYB65_09080 [Chloroflexi bacterium]|nr:hypothetical protein [Chloroflexota bacterium]